MPLRLAGSCRCQAVRFTVESHTPVPYQLCYCSICRKTAGGGGYAINIMGTKSSLDVAGAEAIRTYQATIDDGTQCRTSDGQRHFCDRCATALWLWDPNWPELVHPFASAIDTALPVARERTHLMLRFKPDWVEPRIEPGDKVFDLYPDESIENWHRSRNLWVA
ncbi:GFA family protein [Lichenihabitans sp. Uapishka_5]|uniref:GFA family protein n=1 Tax=Lichenihabitans sp. Uapishka_5 TaxID=3037302 RepID=UPI0029E806A3|nr:GFA family protein [Lichenihabitans sp. Uapishka_5]MDX7952531.1 GFA family protein [Lichenihabitans sp. Uapishka_5]